MPRQPSPRRLAVPVLLAAVAGAVFAAAVAFAVIPDANGVIHGCRNKRTGALRVIDSSSQQCTSREMALDWSQTGPRGPEGPAGPTAVYGFIRPANVAVPSNSTVEIGRLDLPAGTYSVTAKTNLFSSFSGMAAECFLQGPDGSELDRSLEYFASRYPLMINMAVVTLTTSGSVTWHCKQGSESPYQTYGDGRFAAVMVDAQFVS